jgi:lysophospholipase L1-like esterase
VQEGLHAYRRTLSIKRVIIIGDSIAMAYGPLVRDSLAGWAEVWQPEENAGTSANVLAHLAQWALEGRADLIHLNCGLHDLAIDEGDAHRVEPEQYAGNLQKVFSDLRAGTAARLVWVTITPVIDAWHNANKDFCRHEADVEHYNQVARRAVGQVVVNDLHGIVTEAGIEACICEDGVHMTAYGNPLLAGAVTARIREVFADHA